MREFYFNRVPLSRADFEDTLVDRVAFDLAFTAGVHCADKEAALELLRHTAAAIIERVRNAGPDLPVAEGLTEAQAETLRVIQDYMAEHGYAPGYRELSARLHLTFSPIQSRLRALKDLGCIEWEPTKARSIRLLKRL